MKHMNSRRILAMLLALCMMACLLSMTAFAADPLPAEADPDVWDTIVLTKEDGTELVAGTDYTVTRGVYSHYAYTEPFKYNIYNVTTTDAIVISGGASYSNSSLTNPLKSRVSLGAAVTSVTLQNVTALGELSIADGSSVTFTLKNENNIDYIYGKGETTNMTFEGDGSLTGKHIGGVNKYGAEKGTNIGCNITINSGTFNITAGYEAAIGGGQYGDSGKIVINGGNITAKSNYGAAIGGGQYGDAAAIEISSGEINATGSFGAAIGGGQSGDAKEIGIEGGVINARGSHVGAAIGGGQNGNVGKIKITDGDITVVARNMAIGGETADDISISGGNIKLGKLDSSSKEVTPDASQIGSKSSSETSTVTITGGTFKSTDDVVVDVSAYVPEDCTYNPETGEVTKEASESYVARIGTDKYFETLEAAVAAASDGDTILLLKDCFGDGLMVTADRFADKGLTIDFNTHIYTFNGTPVGSTGSETQAAHFESGNKITLKNGKFDAAAGSDVRILVQNYAELTLSKMELDGTNVAQNGTNLFTLSCNNGNVVIEDSTIKAPAKATGQNVYQYAVDICGFAKYDGVSVTVKGTSKINGNIRLASYDAEKARTLKLMLEGGTVSGNLYLGALLDVDRKNTTVTKASSVEMTAPSGYMWDENGTLVKNAAVVARYGGKDYTSLQEAVDAVTDDGGYLYLKADVHLDEALRIVDKAKTGKLYIQLSEHFIYGPAGGAALYVKNSNVRINGGSAEGAESGIAGGTGGDWDVAIWADDGADVTINGGVYSVGVDKDNGGNSTIYVTGSGKVKILAGRFSSEGTYNGKHYVLNLKNGSSGSITVTGQDAEFEEFNPLAGDDVDGGTFCALGIGLVASEKDGKKVYTTKSGTYQVLDAENNPVNVYKDVPALMEKVESGQTVMLLRDTKANITIPAGKDFTLDLNGKTLNGGTGTKVATITNYGNVTITDSSAGESGKIMREDAGTVGETSYYVIYNLGEMTIKNGTICNNSGYEKANPAGVMAGSSLICNSDKDEYPATLNIEGGTLVQENFIAIKNGSSGTLNVSGGKITSKHSAIQNWCNATITGGEINGQLWTDSYDAYSTGKTVISGDAKFTGGIVMDITGNIKPTLEIKGGELDVTSWRVTTGAANAGARPEVSGGTFTSEVPAAYCKDGFVPTTLDGGKYGVKPAEGDAQLVRNGATVKYANLDVLLDEALYGDTIQLRENVTLEVGFMLKDGVCLDLNGKVLTVPYIFIAPNSTACLYDSYEITSGAGVGMLRMATKKATLSCNPSGATRFVLPVYVGTEDVSGKTYYCYRFYRAMISYPSSSSGVTGDADFVTMEFILRFQKTEAYQYIYNEPAQLKIRLDATYFVDETSSKGLYFEFSESYSQQWAARYKDGNPQSEFTFWVKITGLSAFAGNTVYGTPSAMSNYLIASIQGTQLEYQIP